jgi:hypothetical protein
LLPPVSLGIVNRRGSNLTDHVFECGTCGCAKTGRRRTPLHTHARWAGATEQNSPG